VGETESPTSWWQNKVTLWILGLVVAALATAGGLVFNQVRTLQVERSEILRQRDEAVAVATTTTARVLELESSKKWYESRYRRMTLAKNPFTGEALFDRDGKPLFDVDEGSAEGWEELQRSVESLQTQVLQLNQTVEIREQQLATLRLQTSRPSRGPWDFSLAYSAPLPTWFSLPASTLWAGAGYHLELLGLDVAPRAELGFMPGHSDRLGEAVTGKVQVTARP
jgi:hypothetical protein